MEGQELQNAQPKLAGFALGVEEGLKGRRRERGCGRGEHGEGAASCVKWAAKSRAMHSLLSIHGSRGPPGA